MRLFLGIFPDEPTLARLARAARDLSGALPPGLRFTSAERLHLTLAFLGDRHPSLVELLVHELEERLAGLPAFDMVFDGLGAYPSEERARVLWLGVGKGAAALIEVAERVAQAAEACGIERDSRGFAPHLTIARAKRRPLRLPPLPALSVEGFRASELRLVESVLDGPGRGYRLRAEIALDPGETASPDAR